MLPKTIESCEGCMSYMLSQHLKMLLSRIMEVYCLRNRLAQRVGAINQVARELRNQSDNGPSLRVPSLP